MTTSTVIVVDESQTESLLDRRLELLRRFIIFDTIACFAAAAAVMTVAIIAGSGWAAAVAVAALTAGIVIGSALIPLGRGSLSTAFWIVAITNWIVSVTCALLAPVAWPICAGAAFVPAAAAGLFTSPRLSRRVALVAVCAATLIAALGVLQDITGFNEAIPERAIQATLIVGMPMVALVLVVAAQANTNELQSMLTDTRLVNAELKASRTRVVAATDEARRKIERDLHDGAQQRLVGVTLQLSAAREQLASDPEGAAMTLARVRDEVRHAQTELRSLVRGVYPPVLTEHGLGPALQALSDSQALPVRTAITTTPRLSPDKEAAGYFSALEALQNSAKHAGSDVTIELEYGASDQGDIVFEIRDNGRGFSPDLVEPGHGLTNIADRMTAVGGHVEVRSEVGVGTIVRGTLPLAPKASGLKS